MKRKRHTPEQIVRKLREGDRLLNEGEDLTEVLRASRGLGVELESVAGPRRGHESQRSETAQGTRGRERPVEEAARGGRAGQGHAEGVGGGKLLTPDRRRRAVCRLQDRFGVSERRACRVAGQHRSTQRIRPRPRPDDDAELRGRLRETRAGVSTVGLQDGDAGGAPGRLAGEP